jgi:PhnB protein
MSVGSSGVSAVIPRLFCRDVEREINFCIATFNAVEIVRRPGRDGTPAHAMILLGPVRLFLDREWPGLPSRAPQQDGSSPLVMYVYVEDVEKTVGRAVAAGARILRPIDKQLWGDQIGWIIDPEGHVWIIATRTEEVPLVEIENRWSAMLSRPESKG